MFYKQSHSYLLRRKRMQLWHTSRLTIRGYTEDSGTIFKWRHAPRTRHTSYFTFDTGIVTRRSLRVIAMQRGTWGWDAEEESRCDRIVIYCARRSVAKYRCKRYWCVGKLDLRSLTEAVNKRTARSVWTYVYTCLRRDIKWWVNRGNRSIVDSETIANARTIV